PPRDPVGQKIHGRAVDEEGEPCDRLPAAADPLARPPPLESRAHRLVLHAVFGEQRAVALDALPDALDPLGVVLLEVVRRIDDPPRQADEIDLPLGEPALLAELAHEIVAIELLHGVDEPA